MSENSLRVADGARGAPPALLLRRDTAKLPVTLAAAVAKAKKLLAGL